MIHVTFLVEDETLLPPQKNSSRTGQYYFTDAGRIVPGYTAFRNKSSHQCITNAIRFSFFLYRKKQALYKNRKPPKASIRITGPAPTTSGRDALHVRSRCLVRPFVTAHTTAHVRPHERSYKAS